MSGRYGAEVDFNGLPELCISHILSFTSPRDACRSSLVSRIFFSAANSDVVWEKFLPSDYHDILSNLASSSSSSSLTAASLSKKDLYFHLCNHHLLIDDTNKSFALDKWSGRKCYMIGARGLSIIRGDAPNYWWWRSFSDSRFSEIAELVSVRWLEIHGRMNTIMLSPNTNYGAYMVIKFLEGNSGLDHIPVEVSIKFLGGGVAGCTHYVLFDPNGKLQPQYRAAREQYRAAREQILQQFGELRRLHPNSGVREKRFPREREDGWLEIEMGDFFNHSGEEDGEVEMSLMEVKAGHPKSGLIIQGIELRPKETRLNAE